MVLAKRIQLIGLIGGSGEPGWYISPNGFNLYRAASGDTIALIAARFLGSASRGVEIWNIQSPAWRAERGDNTANLRPGDELYMPQEAIDTARDAGLIDGGRGAAPVKATGDKKVLDTSGTDVLKPSTPSAPIIPRAPSTPAKPTPTVPASVIGPGLAASGMSTTTKVVIGAVVALAAVGGGIALARRKKKNPRARRFLLVSLGKPKSKRRRNPRSFAGADDGA